MITARSIDPVIRRRPCEPDSSCTESEACAEHVEVRPVTGPDGDNPITDAMLVDLRDTDPDISEAAACALGQTEPDQVSLARRRIYQMEHVGYNGDDSEYILARYIVDEHDARQDAARTRCAAAYNARHAGKEGR